MEFVTKVAICSYVIDLIFIFANKDPMTTVLTISAVTLFLVRTLLPWDRVFDGVAAWPRLLKTVVWLAFNFLSYAAQGFTYTAFVWALLEWTF